jgi:hypothetical protein
MLTRLLNQLIIPPDSVADQLDYPDPFTQLLEMHPCKRLCQNVRELIHSTHRFQHNFTIVDVFTMKWYLVLMCLLLP